MCGALCDLLAAQARGPIQFQGRGALQAGVNWGAGVWKTVLKGWTLFFPIDIGPEQVFWGMETGGEPDLPNSCVQSRASAILDVLRCLWWAQPFEPH